MFQLNRQKLHLSYRQQSIIFFFKEATKAIIITFFLKEKSIIENTGTTKTDEHQKGISRTECTPPIQCWERDAMPPSTTNSKLTFGNKKNHERFCKIQNVLVFKSNIILQSHLASNNFNFYILYLTVRSFCYQYTNQINVKQME